MGNSDSTSSGSSGHNVDVKDYSHIGYRVVSVMEGSPAEIAGIEP